MHFNCRNFCQHDNNLLVLEISKVSAICNEYCVVVFSAVVERWSDVAMDISKVSATCSESCVSVSSAVEWMSDVSDSVSSKLLLSIIPSCVVKLKDY